MSVPENFFIKSGLRLLFILLVVYGIPACGGDPELAAAEYIANAKDYQDSGDTKAAIIELKNALRANPDNIEALMQSS